MKRKNIRIERGRGIAFTDDKKMRVKGSELGYSLQTIERILARKEVLTAKKKEHGLPLLKQAEINIGHLQKRSEIPDVGMQMKSVEKGLSSLLAQLTKQEENIGEPVAGELMRELKKKKRKGQRHS